MTKKCVIPDISKDKKEMADGLRQLGQRHGIYSTFDDFIQMFAYSISDAVDLVHYEEREERYKEIAKKYSEDELKEIGRLIMLTTRVVNKNLYSTDVLGEIYHGLNLHNEHNGQFFTPMHICTMMAKITLGDVKEQIKEKGYIYLNEPTCGSGAMMIAAAGVVKEQKCEPSTDMCVLAIDNDYRCALMAYIQLSLLGVPAVVLHGDSLLVKEYSRFYTPAYIWNGWIYRQKCSMTDKIAEDDIKLMEKLPDYYEKMLKAMKGE